MKWAYGVTTVPSRRYVLLPRTLDSLKTAGFDQPRLFVDGDPDIFSWKKSFNLEVTVRAEKIRPYGNWVLALAELMIREPTAHRYAIFQDDFVTYKNLRAYLDRVPYPDAGYLNLYTFPANEALAPKGKVGFYPSNQLGLGAVALVFSKDAAQVLMATKSVVHKAFAGNRRAWKNIDGGIIHAFRANRWKEYVHYPSLVQHTGEVSSMANKKHDAAASFLGENTDALTFIK